MRTPLAIAFALLVSSISSVPTASPAKRRVEESGTTSKRLSKLYASVKHLGDVSDSDAMMAVVSAHAAETKRYPAELLLAIAWGESRLIATTITGHACGPMQTIPVTRRECFFQRVSAIGFAAGVHELESWERDPYTRGHLELVLLGYAGGYAAFTEIDHPKRAWPRAILWRARQLGYKS